MEKNIFSHHLQALMCPINTKMTDILVQKVFLRNITTFIRNKYIVSHFCGTHGRRTSLFFSKQMSISLSRSCRGGRSLNLATSHDQQDTFRANGLQSMENSNGLDVPFKNHNKIIFCYQKKTNASENILNDLQLLLLNIIKANIPSHAHGP